MKKTFEEEFFGDREGYSVYDNEVFMRVRNTLIKYNLPVENFDRNLKYLLTKKWGFYQYMHRINKINYVNDNGPLFAHEVFHMASNKPSFDYSYASLDDHSFGHSLNEGITDYMTKLCYKDHIYSYPFEVMMFEMLCELYDKEEILNHHFMSDTKGVYDSFGEDRENIRKMIKVMDRFTKTYQDECEYGDHNFAKCDLASLIYAFSYLINRVALKDPIAGLNYYYDFNNMIYDSFGDDKVELADNVINLLESKIEVGELKRWLK